jgi:hypothetical protein
MCTAGSIQQSQPRLLRHRSAAITLNVDSHAILSERAGLPDKRAALFR